jgi:hypothetical protein
VKGPHEECGLRLKKKKTKKKPTDIHHTQEGMSHGHKPAGQQEVEQMDGKWRRGTQAKGAE